MKTPNAMRSILNLIVLVLCTAVVLSALGVGAASVLVAPRVWFLFMFEIVALVAGVFGIVFALGKFRDGPALALLCIAGAIFASAVLGFLGAGRELGGVSLMPLLVGRVGVAGLLAMFAAWTVLSRRPSLSLARLARSVVWLVVAGLIAGGAAGLYRLIGGAPVVVQLLLGLLAAVTLLGFLAAGVHELIRAFEAGGIDDSTPPPATASPQV